MDQGGAEARVTAPMKAAVTGVLQNAGKFTTSEELIEALCVAVVTADDDNTRWIVLTRDRTGYTAFGPYATATTAKRVLDGGTVLSDKMGVQAGILPIAGAPRPPAATRKAVAQKKPPKKKTPKKETPS